MSNYIQNYLKTVVKYYKPNNTYPIKGIIKPLKYVRGENMISQELKRSMVKELGADAYILYEYFYDTSKLNGRMIPTDDSGIGSLFGWSASKVTRLKSKLKEYNYLLIVKESTTKGTILYKVLLNPNIIEQYKETGELPEEIEVIGKEERGLKDEK